MAGADDDVDVSKYGPAYSGGDDVDVSKYGPTYNPAPSGGGEADYGAAYNPDTGTSAQAKPAQTAAPAPPQPSGLAANAIAPVSNYWSDYNRMRNESVAGAKQGYQDIQQPGFWNKAKGAAEMVGGGMGYVTSPIDAAVHSIIGRPVENVTGIPAGVTDFAAGMALPGVAGKVLGRGAEATAGAGRFSGAPAEAQLGETLHDAVQQGKNDLDAAYKAAYASGGPGEAFHPFTSNVIWDRATQALHADPSMADPALASGMTNISNINAALGRLNTHLNTLATGKAPFTMNNLEAIRRDISNPPSGARFSGTEKHLIGQLVNGFDNGVSEAANMPGMFNGDGPGVVQRMTDARAANRKYQAMFGDGAPQRVRAAVNNLPDDLATANEGHFQQAGTALSRALNDQGAGQLVYNHLDQLGMTPTVDSYMRSKLLSGNAAAVSKNLASPVAQNVMTPEEIARASTLNQTGKPSFAKRALGQGADIGMTIGAGLLHPVAAPFGHLAKEGLTRRLGLTSARPASIYDAMSAPQGASRLGAAAAAGAKSAIWPGLPTFARPDQQPQQPQYARGGKIGGHQHLVDRLMASVEEAKKAEQQRTSPLLQQPDEHIASALRTAQAAI